MQSPSVSKKPVEIAHTQPLTQTEVLQTLNLTTEFELQEAEDWVFQVSRHTLPAMGTFELAGNTGWFVMNKGELGNGVASDGFTATSMVISNTTYESIDVLTATVRQTLSTDKIPTLSVQHPVDSTITTSGLSMLKTWTQPLSSEVPFDKSMRLRHVHLSEQGTVGVHTHDRRPSVAVVLQGVLIEHRGDGDQQRESVISVAERHGLVHWWETTSFRG